MEAEFHILGNEGRLEERKRNFSYLAVKAEQKHRSGELHITGLGRSFFVCCLAHRGSTVGFLLLQCSSGVVRHPRDLVSIFILTVPRRYFCFGSLLLLVLDVCMTTCLGKSCSFRLPRVPFVNCGQFMYLVIFLLVLRAGCGI